MAIARRGSDGVILKAPNSPRVVEAVAELAAAGIPVVTFVTDLPFSRRVAYVGVDNRAAGATAAYLVTRWSGADARRGARHPEQRSLPRRGGARDRLPGDPARAGARSAPSSRSPTPTASTAACSRAVGEALEATPSLDAVYSIGGGNTATLAAFRAAGRTPAVFVAHDLDGDNRALLRSRQISAVLHHDLRADLRRACRVLLQAQGALPGVPASVPSQIQVVTPYNEPGAFGG